MRIEEAALLAYGRIPGPQDATLDLADEMIARERREEAVDVAAAGTPQAALDATYDLEVAAINLRAHTRGMVCDEGARDAIAKARRALAQIESGLQ